MPGVQMLERHFILHISNVRARMHWCSVGWTLINYFKASENGILNQFI